MELKPGVKAKGLQPEALLAMVIAKDIVESYGVVFVITSITEGKHKPGSLHYKGLAFDMRTRDLGPGQAVKMVGDLKLALGSDYDVLFEVDHIHVEFDPK